MKNLKMVKKLIIVMLSLILVVAFNSKVFAADDDVFTTVNSTSNSSTNSESNTATGNEVGTNNVTTNNATTGNTSLTTNNTTNKNVATNNVTSTTSRNVSNTNTLANTGLSDMNGIVALILVVCGVSAIYSYKKVNDYKKL